MKTHASNGTVTLHAAAIEFGMYGYEGASLNRILADAKISKGYAYYYFADKADLFASVVADYWQALWSLVDFEPSQLSREEFWPRLEAFYLKTARYTVDHSWMIGLNRVMWMLPSEVKARPAVVATMGKYVEFLESCILRGRELGLVRSDVPVTVLASLILMVEEIMDRWVEAEEITESHLENVTVIGFDMAKRMLA